MHAGITAEGDNRVIQQKVSKELLEDADYEKVFAHVQLKQEPLASQHAARSIPCDDVTSKDWLLKLFKARQEYLTCDLAGDMFMAKQEGKPLFDTWMLGESDTIQALATAYGENMALEQFAKSIETCEETLKAKLSQLFTLYALDRVITDGVFFMQNGMITAEQSQACQKEIVKLCTELGKDALELTKGFGIPDHMHHAPIANDWVQYNSIENDGELKDQSYKGRDTLLVKM